MSGIYDVNRAMVNLPMGGDSDFGAQLGAAVKNNRLATLASQGIGATGNQRADILKRMTAIDPQAGMKQHESYAALDKQANDDRQKFVLQSGKAAKYLLDEIATGDPTRIAGAKQSVGQWASAEAPKYGLPAPDMDDPQLETHLRKLVADMAPYMDMEEKDTRGVVVGSSLIDPRTGKVMYEGQRQQNRQLIQGADGQYYSVDPMDPNGAAPVIVGGAGTPTVSAGAPEAPSAPSGRMPSSKEVQSELQEIGDRFGFVTTSTLRTPEENKAVGGVTNSQHLNNRGTARDWSVKGKTPAQINNMVSTLRAAGYEVITGAHGTGDHIHAEIPPGGLRPMVASNQGSRGVNPRIQGTPLMGTPKGALTQAQMAAQARQDRRDAVADQRWGIANARADRAEQRAIETAQNKGGLNAQQQLKFDQGKRKENAARLTFNQNVDEDVRLIDEILRSNNLGGVTGAGSMLSKVPGTGYADTKAKLDRLTNRGAFNTLAEMRANSPTGGALGSVSDRENAMLASAAGTLSTAQSPAALAKALREYKSKLLQSKTRINTSFADFYGNGVSPSSQGGGASRGSNVNDLLKKYGN